MRWPAKTSGAFGFGLNFLLLLFFVSRQRKVRKELTATIQAKFYLLYFAFEKYSKIFFSCFSFSLDGKRNKKIKAKPNAPPVSPGQRTEEYDSSKISFFFCTDRLNTFLRVIRKPWRRCVPT